MPFHPLGLLGYAVLLMLAFCMGENRGRIPWRLVTIGTLLQAGIAACILRIPGVMDVFEGAAWLVDRLIAQSDAGIAFLFGNELGRPTGPWGFIFAVKVLPIIVFFASLMSVLYHLKVMQRLVAGLAWLMRRTLGVTGSEAMCMAAGIFLGQTEAPLTVRPLIGSMTRAQLMTVMVGGFANIAGSVLGAYVLMLGGDDPAQRVLYAKHLMASSVMSAPAAFVIARMLVPETETPPPEDAATLLSGSVNQEPATNVFDAAALGATDGLKLAANVGAMLVAFVSLLAVINWALAGLGGLAGAPNLSLEMILGRLFAPLAWTMSVPWEESHVVGSLLGQKLVATEFVAYTNLASMMHPAPLADGSVPAPALSPRSAQIAAYALCGFSNFASIAIQIGGLTILAPHRRKDFSSLALRAMLGGALATQMTACVASLFI